MINTVFRKILGLSLLCHLAVFTLFSLSLNNKIPNINYTSFYFFGRLFTVPQIMSPQILKLENAKNLFFKSHDLPLLSKAERQPGISLHPSYRPMITSGFVTEKEGLANNFGMTFIEPKRREPKIIFHPVLPYGFSLYFNDRQVAHVELMFKVDPNDNPNYIKIKRKVSSGNLEVDLLTTRYIERYLFNRQIRFEPSNWQTVRIDLSGKND